MPRFELRPALPSETRTVASVISHVYGDGTVDDVLESRPLDSFAAEFETYYLGFQDNQPVFVCSVHDYPTVVRGQTVRAAGVASVGTLPEARGHGIATWAMNELMRQLRPQGYHLSMLYAFREPFYRRSGYATCGWRYEIKCPQDRLPRLQPDLPVRRITPDQFELLETCYHAFARSHSGAVLRTPAMWKRRFGRKPRILYALGDPVEAYFWATPESFWSTLEIGELVWSTPRGYRSALALMGRLMHNQTTAKWCEPPSSPFLTSHLDQGVTVSIERPTMMRVIDPGAIFEALGPLGVDLEIEIDDPAEACAEVVRIGRGGPQVQLSVGTLTQAIMGQPGGAELVQAGLVAGRPEAQATFARAFAPFSTVCTEFF